MRVFRVVKRTLIAMVLLVLLGAVALYLLANRKPSEYRPLQLTTQQKDQAVKDFYAELQDFYNRGQMSQPFVWSVTQEQANSYLASLDEIAAVRPGAKHGSVQEAMQKAGICDPAVVFANGTITFMVFSRQYHKVFSSDLALSFTPDERLHVRLAGARVGSMPVPGSVVRDKIEGLKGEFSAQPKGGHSSGPSSHAGAELSAEDVAAAISQIVAAIDDKPIAPDLKVNKSRIKVTGIEIKDGKLTLWVIPAKRREPDRN